MNNYYPGVGDNKKQFRTGLAERNQIANDSIKSVRHKRHVDKWILWQGIGNKTIKEKHESDEKAILLNKGFVKVFDNGVKKRYVWR